MGTSIVITTCNLLSSSMNSQFSLNHVSDNEIEIGLRDLQRSGLKGRRITIFDERKDGVMF